MLFSNLFELESNNEASFWFFHVMRVEQDTDCENIDKSNKISSTVLGP
jgi:hypothetical protein